MRTRSPLHHRGCSAAGCSGRGSALGGSGGGGSRGASACMRSHSLCCLHAIPLARRHFNLDVCIHEYHVCSNISSCMSLKKENRNRAGMQRGRRASSSRASRAAEQQREMCSVQLLLSLKNWKTLTIAFLPRGFSQLLANRSVLLPCAMP